jgi:ribosomal protein S18 acetylase RimI-like enzyme
MPASNAASTRQLLDNITWHTLDGPHALYSCGTNEARRYAPGFSPIIGFADADRPAFAALAPYCEPGERFYCGGWSGPVPDGWQLHTDAMGQQWVWDAALPAADAALAAVRLGTEHVPQMLDLISVTQPGPFAARTGELGDYFGVFESERLVAMAGERLQAGVFREISGVCAHPDFRGLGYARRLVEKLIRIEMQRQQTPFLHVMRDNVAARRLYESMGFRLHQEVAIRVVSRLP